MKKKLISCILSASMLCTSIGILPVKAEKMPAEKTNETYNVMLEKSTYTFGTAFNQIKAFNTSSLSETKIARCQPKQVTTRSCTTIVQQVSAQPLFHSRLLTASHVSRNVHLLS